MIRLGVTGGIGSGKSVVCSLLEVMGVPVYYTDDRAKTLQIENENVRSEIKLLLGEEAYVGNALNKKYIAQKIFSDANLLKAVNGIVHPAVARDFQEWAVRQKREIVAVESAILFESGFSNFVDRVCMVCAPAEVRIERAMRRDGADRESIMRRVASQDNDYQKYSAYVSFFIENNEKSELIGQVRGMLDELRRELYVAK